MLYSPGCTACGTGTEYSQCPFTLLKNRRLPLALGTRLNAPINSPRPPPIRPAVPCATRTSPSGWLCAIRCSCCCFSRSYLETKKLVAETDPPGSVWVLPPPPSEALRPAPSGPGAEQPVLAHPLREGLWQCPLACECEYNRWRGRESVSSVFLYGFIKCPR